MHLKADRNIRRAIALMVWSVVACVSFPDCYAQKDWQQTELQYRPAPALNPLKGLVPYSSNENRSFPHSMEFNYIGYSQLVRGYDEFDWEPLERLLNEISGRGHQAIFRIYLEYPGKTKTIPEFLINDGLRIHKYKNTNTQPLPPADVETPDYEDPRLRRSLRNFVAAMGKKYDGDPRIGFITAGLLGTWGEWHTYPREELFASKTVQSEVMSAYAAAFRTTPILLRYPAGGDTWGKASNADLPFGYHDDSFAWATLDTGRKQDDWFFVPALKQAGGKAIDRWKTFPIGGEVRPEAWGKVFDEHPADNHIQDFRRCVDETHVSWLMDSGMFAKKVDVDRIERAEAQVRHMGYEFHVPQVKSKKSGSTLEIEIELENLGVAPFYYDWPMEYGFVADRKVAATTPSRGQLVGLLPNTSSRTWQDALDMSKLPAGTYTLCLRVRNPLKSGIPLRFANVTQDAALDGWLSLFSIDL